MARLFQVRGAFDAGVEEFRDDRRAPERTGAAAAVRLRQCYARSRWVSHKQGHETRWHAQ